MLPPIGRFELNRMAHARAQELELPGSPAGQNGHKQLSFVAKINYGVRWSDLNVDQMKAIYDHLDSRRTMPVPGDLRE